MHIHIINKIVFGGAETIAVKLSKKFGDSVVVSLSTKNFLEFQKRFSVKVRSLNYLFISLIKNKNLKIFTHSLHSHVIVNTIGMISKIFLYKKFKFHNVIHFDSYFANKIWLYLFIISIRLLKPEIIFVSNFAKVRFNDFYSLKGINVKIINNSIDDIFFKKKYKYLKRIKSKKIYIGFIGRNKSIKRIPLFLEICYELSKIDRKYNFIMQSDITKEEILDLINNLSLKKGFFNLDKNFTIIPSDHNPLKFYDKCDIVISTSKTESFGLVCIESLAMGKRFYSVNSESLEMLIGENDINIKNEDPKFISKFLNEEISKTYIIPNISKFREENMINEYYKI